MLAVAERREFGLLVAWAHDRVDRSTLHALEIVEKLDALGSISGATRRSPSTPPRQLASWCSRSWRRLPKWNASRFASGCAQVWQPRGGEGLELGQKPLEDMVISQVLEYAEAGALHAPDRWEGVIRSARANVQRVLAGRGGDENAREADSRHQTRNQTHSRRQ